MAPKPLIDPAILAAKRLAMDWAGGVPNATWRALLTVSGSHTAGKFAGTYTFGAGDPLVLAASGSLTPISTVYLDPADYPTINSVATIARLRVQLYTNDVAPTGNFTIGLYPITRPAASGTAGQCRYTLGTVISGSTVLFTAPAADGLLTGVSTSFALPAAGHYAIAVVTTANVAANAHLHMCATLAMRN